MLTSKQKVALRKISHSQEILKFTIGKGVIDKDVISMLNNAITKHELIKVSFLKSAISVTPLEQMVLDMSSELKADVVQEIGHTVTLFRKNPKLPNSINI